MCTGMCTIHWLPVYIQQRFVIGYDTDCFANELHVELYYSVDDVSVFDANAMGLYMASTSGHQLPEPFPSVDYSTTYVFLS